MSGAGQHERNGRKSVNRYWLERWEAGSIGWHHQDFNPHLLGFWEALAAPAGCRVLVPLCGKSRDMVWLAERGHEVVGVELSPLAVEGFFDEQALAPARETLGGLESWRAGPYQILCGDIFAIGPTYLKGVAAVYDRASLVALDPKQRRAYAQLLKRLLPSGTRMLLVAMDYAQQEMAGPPYSVEEAEVKGLFSDGFSVEQLDSLDLLKDSGRYADRGLSRLHEQVYRLRRK
jgi:thiopurine S-methyltransferase